MSDLENKIDEINKAQRQEHRKENARKTISKFTESVSKNVSNTAKEVKDYIESKKAKVKKFFNDLDEKKEFDKKAKETYESFLQLADELKDEDYLTKSGNSQEIDGEVVIAKGDVAPIVCTTYNHENYEYDSQYGYPIRDVSYEGFIDTKISGVSQKVYVNIRNASWDKDRDSRYYRSGTDFYEGIVRMPNGKFEKISCESGSTYAFNNGSIKTSVVKELFKDVERAYEPIKEALERKEREERLSKIPERVPDDY